jgi:tryptophanyl-tRNA synthetase
VGKDQVQHIEMAADIAEAVNRNYKQDLLTVPEAHVSESTQTVIGMDGRKMSKSYGNTIPLFLPEKKLRKLLNKIVTNSQEIEEPKDPDTCNVFALYRLFASEEQQDALAARYRAGGMGWGYAKGELFEVMNSSIKPMRDKYDELMADKRYIDEALARGARKARNSAAEKISRLRKAMGVDL